MLIHVFEKAFVQVILFLLSPVKKLHLFTLAVNLRQKYKNAMNPNPHDLGKTGLNA